MNGPPNSSVDTLGVVAIGRNEGERLKRCLESLQGVSGCLVYVDSGSTDNSVSMARELGAEVVVLDTTRPFTAARARNLGFERLCEIAPNLKYVQFVDGDCEILDGWLETAAKFLDDNPEAAVACGLRKERYPRETIYNLLCDMEWNSPVGEVAACGGDSLIRIKTLLEVGVFDPTLIAGEEPEMCYRFRLKGWKIYRLDHDMTLHDAAMTRFSQWWNRAIRGGFAYAEGQSMYGGIFTGYRARDVWSIVIWALFFPVFGITLAYWTQGPGLLVLLVYVLLWWRIRRYRIGTGDNSGDASLYAGFCILGKFAQLVGVFRYWKNYFIGRQSTLIEYK